ncbi:MAG: DUF1501 domain-containing protein [Acidimicrobiales bacterium]|nr:DUF1501 domain-containing protein [Acidimicrobiales bacterium]
MTNQTLSPTLDRRAFLRRSALAGVGAAAATIALPHGVALATPGRPHRGDLIVSVTLDGGMDGLAALVPYHNNTYYNLRPQTSIAPPGQPGGCIDLDGTWGLHPALAPLLGAWNAGHLAFVEACGTPSSISEKRSHFEMLDALKHAGVGMTTGWAARHMNRVTGRETISAQSFSSSLDQKLAGFGGALSGWTLQPQLDYASSPNKVVSALDASYGGSSPVGAAGQLLIESIQDRGQINFWDYDHNGSTYPNRGIAWSLRNTAMLARAAIGVEFVSISSGGWDTHDNQGNAQGGHLLNRFQSLAGALAAFYADMLATNSDITLVITTEFGRLLTESSTGTDHGRASVMMALGRHVNGGIHGLPTQIDPDLDDRAVPVRNDYQTVLAEMLVKRRGETSPATVFPNWQPSPFLGVFKN